jgi:hypothetical protein
MSRIKNIIKAIDESNGRFAPEEPFLFTKWLDQQTGIVWELFYNGRGSAWIHSPMGFTDAEQNEIIEAFTRLFNRYKEARANSVIEKYNRCNDAF